MEDLDRHQPSRVDDAWFIVLMVQMWMIHTYALGLPGYGFKDSVRVKEAVAVVAPGP